MKLPDHWYYRVERVNELLANRNVTGSIALVVIAAIIGGVLLSRHHPLPRGIGELAPPIQHEVERPAWRHAGHTLTPIAEFEVEALVVHARTYRWGRFARVSATDLGVAWSPVVRDDVLDALAFDQYRRFLFFEWQRDELPIPVVELEHAVSNIHTIGASSAIRRQLRRVNAGDIVRLRGVLVDVTGDDGWVVPTSRGRSDRGAGACEVLWVESVSTR